MQKNQTKKKSVSAVVFTDSVLKFFGVGLKISFLAENTIKIVVSASFQTGKNSQKLAKMWSQKLVQGCVKTWSKYVAQQNWTKFWLKKWCLFLSFFLLVFLKNLILPAERRRCLKNKKRKKRENLDQVLTQKKAIFGPSFDSTAHIYIYAVELKAGPIFAFFSAKSWFIFFFCFWKSHSPCRKKRIFKKKKKKKTKKQHF